VYKTSINVSRIQFPVIQLFQDGGWLILLRSDTRSLVEIDQGIAPFQ
jgi:hypothetical protein